MEPQAFKSKITPITNNIAERIKKWAKPEFDPQVISFQLGLCETCRRQLSNCEKPGAVSTKIQAKLDDFKLQNIHIPRGQEARTFCCNICCARKTRFGVIIKSVSKKIKIVPRGEPEKEKNKYAIYAYAHGPCDRVWP